MHISRLVALGIAALTVSACRDSGLAAPNLDLVRLIPAGGSQVVIQQEAGLEPGTVTYVVRVLSRRSDLASFQGSVTFASGAFELVGTATPVGGEGEMFLVNPEMAEGRIRFAAFATEKFSSDEAFRFSVRPLTALAEAQMRASLDVAGIVGGAALQAAQLRESDGVRDARGHLIEN